MHATPNRTVWTLSDVGDAVTPTSDRKSTDYEQQNTGRLWNINQANVSESPATLERTNNRQVIEQEVFCEARLSDVSEAE